MAIHVALSHVKFEGGLSISVLENRATRLRSLLRVEDRLLTKSEV